MSDITVTVAPDVVVTATVGIQGPPGGGLAGSVESVNGQTGVVVLAASDVSAEPVDSNIQTHIGTTGNPHGTTAADVGAVPVSVTDTFLGVAATTTVVNNGLNFDITRINTTADDEHRISVGGGFVFLTSENYTNETASSINIGANLQIMSTGYLDLIAPSIKANGTPIGTAAVKNAPATGNALSTEVVLGADTRLTDARTPAAHTQSISTIDEFSIATPAIDEILRYNGASWVNGAPVSSSASAGIEFYPDDAAIIAAGTQTTYPIKNLSKTPVSTAEDVDTITLTTAGVVYMYGAYLYDTALGRTTIDAGTWGFDMYCGADSATGVTTVSQNINRVRVGTGTVTTTGTGTSRTVTASSGTPFAVADIDVSATLSSASFVQTTTGFFPISARTSDTVVTITVPSTYTNQSGVAYSVHKKLFGVTTPELNNISGTTPTWTGLALYSINSVQPAYSVIATDKLSNTWFGTSTSNNRSAQFAHNGTARYSHFQTPLITLHGNLAGLQGGTGSVPNEEYYHLTSAQLTANAYTNVVQTYTAAQAGEVTSLTVSGNAVAVDLSLSNNFSVTLQATTGQTLSAPSNPVAGMSGAIEITQNATPSTLAYNTFWKFSGGTIPTVTATNEAKDIFTYYCPTASYAVCSLIKGVA